MGRFSFLSFLLLSFIATIFTFVTTAVIFRVSEIFRAVSGFLILYPDTRFSKTRRTSKNLASFLFTFLSLRRSMMDRNKRRNSSETLLCNYILSTKGRFHVFYFIGVHAETVARQAKIKHDSRSFFTLKKPIRMRKESYRSH